MPDKNARGKFARAFLLDVPRTFITTHLKNVGGVFFGGCAAEKYPPLSILK
jgi:hypothetical protein